MTTVFTLIKDWWYSLRSLNHEECAINTMDTEESVDESISKLVSSAIWVSGKYIDTKRDILGWVNDNLEELLAEGTTEVNIIQGGALSEFVKHNQSNGRYTEISPTLLDTMLNSVIIISTDGQGNIIDDQMIRSNGGLSSQSQAQFNGQPIIKIKIQS